MGYQALFLTFFESYLQNRYQRVVLNGTESNWKMLHAGVPQGSVLGPLLFIVYINDLTNNITSKMRLFADDSSLFTGVEGTEQMLMGSDVSVLPNDDLIHILIYGSNVFF